VSASNKCLIFREKQEWYSYYIVTILYPTKLMTEL
jgi:hypothetical protein